MEEFRYEWKLRGGLAWIAGLRFPTSGVGSLRNVWSGEGDTLIDSELRITPRDNSKGYGFYVYQSQIDDLSVRTLMTYNGYAWGTKRHTQRTLFDYIRRLARTREESDIIENRVKPIPSDEMRDVLTGIHYLRRNAGSITAPLTSQIYSDGKMYPVVFKPGPVARFKVEGQPILARSYSIVAAPRAAKKWPGGVKVWLTEDARRIPVRIEIVKVRQSLRLELVSAEGCK